MEVPQVPLKEVFETRLIDYKEQVNSKFEAVAAKFLAVYAKFEAVEKQTSIAFSASEEARKKAEATQLAKNETTNEFRGQLADQAATLMPRKEVELLVSNLDSKTEAKFEAFLNKIETRFNALEEKLGNEKSRGDTGAGKSEGMNKLTSLALMIGGFLLAIAGFIFARLG